MVVLAAPAFWRFVFWEAAPGPLEAAYIADGNTGASE
jgi:hypothetical protein